MQTVEEYSAMIEEQGGSLKGLDLLYAYLSDVIFDYIAYDDDLSIEMGKSFYKVIDSIINETQDQLIESDFYSEYITILNLMRINCDKINWGTSIRFPWFEYDEDGYWDREHYDCMIKTYNNIKELLKSR